MGRNGNPPAKNTGHATQSLQQPPRGDLLAVAANHASSRQSAAEGNAGGLGWAAMAVALGLFWLGDVDE